MKDKYKAGDEVWEIINRDNQIFVREAFITCSPKVNRKSSLKTYKIREKNCDEHHLCLEQNIFPTEIEALRLALKVSNNAIVNRNDLLCVIKHLASFIEE